MMRNYPVDSIHLSIEEVIPFNNDRHSGIIFKWSSDIGFGEYTIYKNKDGWFADSENMDSNNDKSFIKELMKLWIKDICVM